MLKILIVTGAAVASNALLLQGKQSVVYCSFQTNHCHKDPKIANLKNNDTAAQNETKASKDSCEKLAVIS